MAEEGNDQNQDGGQEMPSLSKDDIIRLVIVGIVAVLMLLVIIVGMAMMSGLTGNNAGGGHGLVGGGSVDCSGVAKLTTEQYQWVKDASNKYLGGDEAKLIALIQIESGWRVDAKAPGSSAAGLAQFVTGTARGYKEFTGGNDGAGTDWPAGNLYDDPASHADDARFDAKRSIYAASHKLKGHLEAAGGNLGEAYQEGYHSYCRDMSNASCVKQKEEAQAGRARLEQEYQKLINGGGCKFSGGVACGVVNVSSANANLTGVKHPQLMPPAANDFNNLAAEYEKRTGKKLGVTSMFRTQEEQIELYREKPGLANPPGTSMHEAGLAIDFNLNTMSNSDYETLKAISASYNWQVNRGSGGVKGAPESWHFDYIGLKDKYWYGPTIAAAITAANNTSCGT